MHLQNSFSTFFAYKKSEIRDGMDIAICTLDLTENKLYYAGANNPLVYIQEQELRVIKGDKRSIGEEAKAHKPQTGFTLHTIDLHSPTTLYLFSDGYQDQFNGKTGRKFYSRNLYKLLFEIHELPMKEQHSLLKEHLMRWRYTEYQTDDVTLLGVRV